MGVTASKDNNGYRIEPHYANGQAVKDGDKLYFNAQIYSDDSANKFNRADLQLCEVYIKDFDQGVSMGITAQQNSTAVGKENAGSMAYQIADSSAGSYRPNLKHPVAYIKMPSTVTVSDLSEITVKTGTETSSFGKVLTPRSISVVQVGGANFIKVDLSNYDLIPQGFTIKVPYGNSIDAQTGAEHSPFLVVADNLDEAIKNVAHFSSDSDAKTDAAMRALIAQEGINTAKTSYVGTTTNILHNAQWVIAQGIGMFAYTMVSDNQSAGLKTDGQQSLNKVHPEAFNIYGSISNATSEWIEGAVEIVNLPDTVDGHSQFTPVMTGPANMIALGHNSGGSLTPVLLYRLNRMDLDNAQSSFNPDDGTWLTADQIRDWSQVKAVAINLLGQKIPPYTTLRLEIPLRDNQIYAHLNKSIYVASAIFSQGVEANKGLPTLTIEAGSPDSAKLTVVSDDNTKAVQDSVTKRLVVHYVYADGSQAADDVQKDVTFNRAGIRNLTTNEVTWGAWDHDRQTFPAIVSPTISGYTADRAEVSNVSVTAGSPNLTEVTVTYRAGQQLLTVDFIDDTTGKILKTVTRTGQSGADAGYNTAADIQAYRDAHYELVSDDTHGANLVFDNDATVDQHYAVRLKHQTDNVTDTKTVRRTIHYVYADGTPASDDVVQTATFRRDGQVDRVTQSTVWGAWNVAEQSFDRVVSPQIAGYTASQAVVAGMTVTPASDDSELTVIYSQNADGHGDHGQPSQPGQPGQPDQPGQPEQPGQPTQSTDNPGQAAPRLVTPTATAQTPTASQPKLPQTGDHDNHAALAAGFMGLAGFMALLGLGKKRQRD